MAEDAFVKTKKLIEQRFEAKWAELGGTLPLQFEGVPLKTPVGQKYVRLSIRFADSMRETIGTTHTEKHVGAIFVNIYWPQGEGSVGVLGEADRVSKALRNFQGKEAGVVVTCKTPRLADYNDAAIIAATVVVEFDSRVTITSTP